MVGMRGGPGRLVAMVLALVAAIFLALAAEARAVSAAFLGAALDPASARALSTSTVDPARGTASGAFTRAAGFDTTAPAAPMGLRVAGGGGWRRSNGFVLEWQNPAQGGGTPIVGAYLRLVGANGYDTGARYYFAGSGIDQMTGVQLPFEGDIAAFVWLRDEAGNEDSAAIAEVHLDLDATPPTVAFLGSEGDENRPPPTQVAATFLDPLSGPGAGGTISYRRAETTEYVELPTALQRESNSGATLTAPMPALPPGNWVFRVEAADSAGNLGVSSLRGDGTQMAFRIPEPAPAPSAPAPGPATSPVGSHPPRGSHPGQAPSPGAPGRASGGSSGDAPSPDRLETKITARLRGGHRSGEAVTVPFGASARLTGRLATAAGTALAGRKVKVVLHPAHGALASRQVARVLTGAGGSFSLRLPAGTSRRITVVFPGNASLAPSGRSSASLRVRSGVTLEARPTALRTGRSIRLSGQVSDRGAAIPHRGKLVTIQYLERASGRWQPALVARTDRRGHFEVHYRFRYITGLAHIHLRATALPEAGWPFASGSSGPVTVEVRGG